MSSSYDRIPSPVLSTYICFHQSRSRDNYGTKPAIHLPAHITFGGGDCSSPTIQPCSCPPTPPVPLWPSLVSRMHTLTHDSQWVCMYVCMPACVEACMYAKAEIAAFSLLSPSLFRPSDRGPVFGGSFGRISYQVRIWQCFFIGLT